MGGGGRGDGWLILAQSTVGHSLSVHVLVRDSVPSHGSLSGS